MIYSDKCRHSLRKLLLAQPLRIDMETVRKEEKRITWQCKEDINYKIESRCGQV
uniref:Uncharacterized protein n=1 Tax=Arion vulgaris TaxID=1028688 RepID=A0A0B6Z2S8_9EUPU